MPPPCYKTLKSYWRFDDAIETAIRGCHPRDWNEDHITYSWLKSIINLGTSIETHGLGAIRVSWDAYKQDGRLEEANGDVAFLIQLIFPNQNVLVGVAFLEAKRIYKSGKYTSLKWHQLQGMNILSAYHQLLLYDFEPQLVYSQAGCCCWRGPCDGCERPTSGMVVPTSHALALEEKDRSLTSSSSRLSEQIFFRYFRGLDLNFDKALVEQVLNGIAGGAKFLTIATVRVGNIEGANIGDQELAEGEQETHLKPSERSSYRRINKNNE